MVDRTVALPGVVTAFLVLAGLLVFADKSCNQMPKEMAEKGLCWQTILVPAQPGVMGTSYSAYAPCALRVIQLAPGSLDLK